MKPESELNPRQLKARRYYLAHKEEIKAQAKVWRESHNAQFRALQKVWQARKRQDPVWVEKERKRCRERGKLTRINAEHDKRMALGPLLDRYANQSNKF